VSDEPEKRRQRFPARREKLARETMSFRQRGELVYSRTIINCLAREIKSGRAAARNRAVFFAWRRVAYVIESRRTFRGCGSIGALYLEVKFQPFKSGNFIAPLPAVLYRASTLVGPRNVRIAVTAGLFHRFPSGVTSAQVARIKAEPFKSRAPRASSRTIRVSRFPSFRDH